MLCRNTAQDNTIKHDDRVLERRHALQSNLEERLDLVRRHMPSRLFILGALLNRHRPRFLLVIKSPDVEPICRGGWGDDGTQWRVART